MFGAVDRSLSILILTDLSPRLRRLDHRTFRVAHDHDADIFGHDHVQRADQRVWRYEQRHAAIDLRQDLPLT